MICYYCNKQTSFHSGDVEFCKYCLIYYGHNSTKLSHYLFGLNFDITNKISNNDIIVSVVLNYLTYISADNKILFTIPNKDIAHLSLSEFKSKILRLLPFI